MFWDKIERDERARGPPPPSSDDESESSSEENAPQDGWTLPPRKTCVSSKAFM